MPPTSALDQALGVIVPIAVVVFIGFSFYAKKPEIFRAIGRFFVRIWESFTESGSKVEEVRTELTFK